MASQERNLPFIKNLAASDKKTRTSALNSLRTLLSARHTAAALTPLDVLKLWKGLFYAVWMCDRPLPQQALCSELAALIHILPAAAVAPWLRGFWATVAREWSSIDALRLNKFLLLVRRMFGASLLWMKVQDGEAEKGPGKKRKAEDSKARWDAGRVDEILGLLGEWPFVIGDEARGEKEAREREDTDDQDSLTPQYVPVGLKLHALDIWVDESERVGLLEDEEDAEAQAIVRRIRDLVEALEKGTMSTAVRIRSRQSLADDRLPGNPEADQDEEDSD